MQAKVLVTGGSGRLGAYICPLLKRSGFLVTNFDVAPPPSGGTCDPSRIPYVRGDVTSLADCMRAIEAAGAEIVIHLAAGRETPVSDDDGWHADASATMRINVMGTYCLVDACRRTSVKHLVAASSYHVLGLGPRPSGTPYTPFYLPIDEDHPCAPEDAFGLSKLLDEEILKSFSRAYPIRVTVLRLPEIHYPSEGDDENDVRLGISVPAWREGDSRFMNATTYQYLDARDAAEAFARALDARLQPTESLLADFEVFFVATDTRYVEDTVDVVAKRWPGLAGMDVEIRDSRGVISTERAERVLGFTPSHSWRTRTHR